MDPQQQTPPNQTPPPQAPSTFTNTPEPKHKKSMLSFFMKGLGLVVFAVLLLGGGYYFGMQSPQKDMNAVPSPAPTNTPTVMLPSPTTILQNSKTVKAGLAVKDSSFVPYTIQILEGWTDVQETTVAAGIDKLTLTKNGYSLTIYQAAIGGGGCLYPEDEEKPMSTTFTDFADITAGTIQFRRSWDEPNNAPKTLTYTICQKSPDGGYGNITNFGVITAVSPNPADKTILSEIDTMIGSLAKQ